MWYVCTFDMTKSYCMRFILLVDIRHADREAINRIHILHECF